MVTTLPAVTEKQEAGENPSGRSWLGGALVAGASGLLAAIVGGLVGGHFAISAVDREATTARESAALELKREALDGYVQAYAASGFLTNRIFLDASDVADGLLPSGESIMAKEGNWREGSYRVSSANFAEVQQLRASGARLEVLFSSEVAECAQRIEDSLRIYYWELSALATRGDFEWFSDQGIATSWRDHNAFTGLFGVMRRDLYDTLVDLAREETDLEPLMTSQVEGPQDCGETPYYVRDSSTECRDGDPTRCLELTDARWQNVLSGDYTSEDLW